MVDVNGYLGLYEINTNGDIYSLTSKKYLKQRPQNFGYQTVILFKNNVKKVFSVHRLVAKAFIPNPENKPCVNHKNGIKTDNRVENLEWVTYSENTLHSYKNNLQIIPKGESHHLYGKKPYNLGYNSKIKKFCNVCDKRYKTYNVNSKYCSHNCRNEANRIRMKKLKGVGMNGWVNK